MTLIPTVTAAKVPKAAVSFVTIRTSLIERIVSPQGPIREFGSRSLRSVIIYTM